MRPDPAQFRALRAKLVLDPRGRGRANDACEDLGWQSGDRRRERRHKLRVGRESWERVSRLSDSDSIFLLIDGRRGGSGARWVLES
jgi:hypothetical protein